MANVKITDLTAYTDAASTDVLPVVDVTNDVTKKISISNLLKAAPLGSAAAPGIAFDGDPNTGVYSPGADQVAISTNGSERLRVTTTGLGIGTSSPFVQLTNVSSNGGLVSSNSTGFAWQSTANDWAGAISSRPSSGNSYALRAHTEGTTASDYILFASSGSGTGTARFAITGAGNVGIGSTSDPGGMGARLWIDSTTDSYFTVNTTGSGSVSGINFRNSNANGEARFVNNTGGPLTFYRSIGNEAARIDSSGRLLVGTSTAFDTSILATVYGAGIEGNGQFTGIAVKTNKNSVESAYLVLGKSRGTTANSKTIVQSGDGLGFISFEGADGTNMLQAATIVAQVDGTPGANDMPGRLVFSTTADGASSPTERMRIKNNGTIQLGNGTLGLTGTLVIDPASVGMGYPMTINNPVSGSTNEVVIDIYRQGVRTGYITNTNTVTSYTSTSDYRLKENILPVTDGIARLKQLKPSRFNFIIEPEIIVDGFLAHEVQAVVPEAITGEKDEVDSNGNPVYQGIDQSKLVPLLTAALQEAVAKIESLEARLTAAGI